MWKRIKSAIDRNLQVALRDVTDLLLDNRAMQLLSPLQTEEYAPWPGPAMRPSALSTILNEIVLNERTNIVECGAGVSTLYIGRLLRQLGGQQSIVSFEHDEGWARKICEMCEREGLTNVHVIHTPLTASDLAQDDSQWYDRAIVDATMTNRTVDLLIVDGPNAYRRGEHLARYPAVPVFRPYFEGSWCVILDDIRRPGESNVLEQWAVALEVDLEMRNKDSGIGILRFGSAWSV